MEKTKKLMYAVAGAVLALALTVGLGGGLVRAETAGGCEQWEVMVETATAVTETREYGKPFVKKAPAGWEPFAVGDAGLLLFRRCTK